MSKFWIVLIILIAALIATFMIGFWAWLIAAGVIIGRTIVKSRRRH